MVADTARLRKAKETTIAEWRRKKRAHYDEQARNGPKQRKAKAATQVGRTRGKGRHTHNASRALRTRGMGRSASQKILMLEVASTEYSFYKPHNRQYRMATNSAERRKLDWQRKIFRKKTTATAARKKQNKRKQQSNSRKYTRVLG